MLVVVPFFVVAMKKTDDDDIGIDRKIRDYMTRLMIIISKHQYRRIVRQTFAPRKTPNGRQNSGWGLKRCTFGVGFD